MWLVSRVLRDCVEIKLTKKKQQIFDKKRQYSGISYTSEITYDCYVCETYYLTDNKDSREPREGTEIARKKKKKIMRRDGPCYVIGIISRISILIADVSREGNYYSHTVCEETSRRPKYVRWPKNSRLTQVMTGMSNAFKNAAGPRIFIIVSKNIGLDRFNLIARSISSF